MRCPALGPDYDGDHRNCACGNCPETLPKPKPFFEEADTEQVAEQVNGTCLQGEINISFRDLCSIFGDPHNDGDGHKVDAEWILQFNTPDGPVIATIYNYKTGKSYNGRSGLATSRIRDWHIGGKTTEAVRLVRQAILITPRKP